MLQNVAQNAPWLQQLVQQPRGKLQQVSPAAMLATFAQLEAGIAAIGRVLDARGGDALHSDLKPATQATDYGVWSTTHLLGMAYAGEQAYILWLLDDSEDWRRLALVLLHRYVYVVEVLMVGCGWSVKRPKELLGLLGGRKAVESCLAKEWGADEAIA